MPELGAKGSQTRSQQDPFLAGCPAPGEDPLPQQTTLGRCLTGVKLTNSLVSLIRFHPGCNRDYNYNY